MVDVIIAHPSLNRGGGAEKVCLSLIKALVNAGYNVRLATLDKTDWETLEGRFGKIVKPSSETHIITNTSSFSALLQAATIASLFPLMLLRLRHEKHGVLVNTYGDLVDYLADLAYVNAIPIKLAYRVSSGLSSSLTWRIATNLYNRVSLSPQYKSLLVSNSKFIQHVLLRNLGRRSIVIYPPVEIEIFMKEAQQRRKHENLVVVVSRIRPGKRLDIIPQIASLAKEAEFIILGIADSASKTTLKEINLLIKHFKVNERVKILLNQKFENYVNILASANIYLHTQPSEAFGISVVEAMAAGCIPLVPKSGGPWTDILDCTNGLYGFSYKDEKEAANIINILLNNKTLRRKIREKALKRTLSFSGFIFERKILNIINKIMEKSSIHNKK